MTTTASPIVAGSAGLSPNSKLDNSRIESNATGNPANTPTSISRKLSRKTSQITVAC